MNEDTKQSMNKLHDHLRQETSNSKTPENLYEASELFNQGLTYDQIANQLGISKGTITKWKKKYFDMFVSVSSVSG